MQTSDDIEAYLMRSGLGYEELAPNTWRLADPSSGETMVLRLDGPLLLFRVKVLDLHRVSKRRSELFERLLELNATEMVHGSYGIADGAVVLTATHRVDDLDYSEFQGTIDDFSLALTNHYETLASYRDVA